MNIVKIMRDYQAAVARDRWPDHSSSWRCAAAVDGCVGVPVLFFSSSFFPFLLSRRPPVHVVLVVSSVSRRYLTTCFIYIHSIHSLAYRTPSHVFFLSAGHNISTAEKCSREVQ